MDLQASVSIRSIGHQGVSPVIDLLRRARDFLRHRWDGPCFMAVGVKDPVLGVPVMTQLQQDIRGASSVMMVEEGGHFLQEWGEDVAQSALRYFAEMSSTGAPTI